MGIFSLFVEDKPEITIFGQLLDLLHARHEHRQNNQYIVASTGGVVRRETGGPDCRHTNSRPPDSRINPNAQGRHSNISCLERSALASGRFVKAMPGQATGFPNTRLPLLAHGLDAALGTGSGGGRPRADQQTPNQSRRASTENDSRAHRRLFSSGPRSHHALATEVEPDNEVRHRPGRVCRPVASQQTGTGRTSSG